MPDVSVLDVHLYGNPVGTLTHVGGDRTLFSFNNAYVADANRPILGLSFKDTFGELITDFSPTQTKVLPFFSNLLPEGHMRTYLADRAGVKPAREFFLLWVLGMDLPGAITILPAGDEAWPSDPDDRAADHDDRGDVRENAMRFSLAGIQLKFSAIDEARGGLSIPAKGVGGSWIVKLPSREFEGIPENEFSMMTLARLVGIDVPAVHLIDVAAIGNMPEGISTLRGHALAIERFDRQGSECVHVEDFAQIFGVYPEHKYKKANYSNIASVIAAESGHHHSVEFIRRLTFNTLIGNADMHLKNWSMMYPDRRNAVLAPAYDLVSTIPYIPDRSAALRFSRTKRFDEFSEDELSHLAAKAMLPEKLVLDTARETVALFHQHWRTEKPNLPLSAATIQAIDGHLVTIPIA